MNINKDSKSEKVEIINLTEREKERLDKIFNSYVDAHNLILENIIDANKNKKSYTFKKCDA